MMLNPNLFRSVFGAVILLLAWTATAQNDSDKNPKPQTPLEIISNPNIWGKDFPLALAYLEAVAKSGEKTVELHPNSLVRSLRFSNARLAMPDLQSTNLALQGAERLELYQKVQKNFPFQSRTPKTELVKAAESDSVQVGLNFGQVQFFKPDIRITSILKEIGPPERVSYQTINGRGEERPLIYTLYSYADGAIIFVESNFSAEPRLLDRVYFDASRVVNSLKTNLK